jgi:hypothetical protein
VAKATVGTDIDEPLDVHRDLFSEVTLNLVIILDHITDRSDFGLRKIAGLDVTCHIGSVTDVTSSLSANAKDIRERNVHALVAREIYTFNTCHGLTLPLFVLGVLTDDAQDASPLYDATLVTDLLYRSAYFHFGLPSPAWPVQQVFWFLSVENSKNLCSVRGDGDGVLEVGRKASVRCHHRPKIV